MTQEEIKILSEKMANGSISPEEKLALFKEMNAAIDGIRSDVASLKAIKNINN